MRKLLAVLLAALRYVNKNVIGDEEDQASSCFTQQHVLVKLKHWHQDMENGQVSDKSQSTHMSNDMLQSYSQLHAKTFSKKVAAQQHEIMTGETLTNYKALSCLETVAYVSNGA